MTQFFNDHTVYDPGGGVYYVPFIAEDGRIGYAIRDIATGSVETFIYFNPSTNTEDDPDQPNVFVYQGGDNDPSVDTPLHHYLTHPRYETTSP